MKTLENLNYLFSNEEEILYEDYEPLDENNTSNRIAKAQCSNYEYNFQYEDKVYLFSLFSNQKLQEFDRKMLVIKEKREILCLSRTLKLVTYFSFSLKFF